MKKINYKKIGMAVEAVGVTITTAGITDLSRGWLISGMVITAIGRGLNMILIDEK
jgi:hypothetical protein